MWQKLAGWLVALAVLFTALSAQAQDDDGARKRTQRVGVVLDGPAPRLDGLLTMVQREIKVLLGDEFTLVFDPAKRLQGDWKTSTAKRQLERLVGDDDVDIVFAFGVVASNEAVKMKRLKKPVIAPFVLNAELQGLKRKDGGRIRRKNLSYLIWSLHFARDFKMLSEFGEFKHIAYMVNGYVAKAIPSVRARAVELAKAEGVEVHLIEVEMDVKAALAAIPANTDAVYVGPNAQLTLDDIDTLAKGLVERKLPSFAWFGRAEVERGLMTGLATPKDVERLVRRLALNTQAILLGDAPEDLVTGFSTEERLVINMATVRALGISPDFMLITEAELLKKPRTKVSRRLSLVKAVRIAQDRNLDLKAVGQGVLAGEEHINVARAPLLPQLSASLTGSIIDKDRAGLGSAERTLFWSATLSQSLFSERAWANFTIQKALQKSRLHDERAAQLDTVYSAAVAYLNLLRARTAETIQRANLKSTRTNLGLARSRVRIGTGRQSEVLRWESSIAQRRSAVITAASQRNLAEMELNRVLNRPLEESFVVKEASIDDTNLLSAEPRFRRFMSNPGTFRKMRAFMVKEGISAAPELKGLAAVLEAKEREVTSHELAPFLPTLGAQASVSHRFLRGGEGSDDPAPIPGVAFPMPNNFDWQVGATLTLPIYEGGERYAAARRSRAEKQQLTLQQKALAQRIETSVRASLHQAGASLPAIRLSRAASDAAAKSLKLVSSAYSSGAASIVELIDAQNQALVADLAATTAVYDFLVDLMSVERAMGKFDLLMSKSDMTDFFRRLEAYVNRGKR